MVQIVWFDVINFMSSLKILLIHLFQQNIWVLLKEIALPVRTVEKYSDDIKIWSNISAFTLERDRSAAPCATKASGNVRCWSCIGKFTLEKAFRMFHMLQTVLWFRRSEDTHGNSYWRETSQLSFVLQKLPSASSLQAHMQSHLNKLQEGDAVTAGADMELIPEEGGQGELDDMEGVCGVFCFIAAISSAFWKPGASEDSMDFSCLFRVKVICVYNKAHNIALICFSDRRPSANQDHDADQSSSSEWQIIKKPYHCAICNKTFSLAISLKRHQLIFHPGRIEQHALIAKLVFIFLKWRYTITFFPP